LIPSATNTLPLPSTGIFMREMYGRRLGRTAMSKAEALRQAQLAFLHHSGSAAMQPDYLSHPFYWAPFILMGNWL
jgi:CHAT domain-containing protein